MKRSLAILCLLCLLCPLCPRAEVMKVMRQGENLYISAKMDAATDIVYHFKPCMFNRLFTFYRVGMVRSDNLLAVAPGTKPGVVLNEASSDNIGPFGIKNASWVGGNHSFADDYTIRTAQDAGYRIFADGTAIDADTSITAASVTIEVDNVIFNPLSKYRYEPTFGDTLCFEHVVYKVLGNSIDVAVSHRYANRIPLTVDRYYGMQSMFVGETSLLTPGGKYAAWTPIKQVGRFTKRDYPAFHHFIERNEAACQSSFLLPDGLGGHSQLADDDVVFIGNSFTKSYHKLIADRLRVAGDEDSWHGVYTWFSKPLYDEGGALAFLGAVSARRALFFSCPVRGKYVIPISQKVKLEKSPRLKCKSKSHHLEIKAAQPFDGYIFLKN